MNLYLEFVFTSSSDVGIHDRIFTVFVMDIDSKKSIFESLDERSAAGVLVPMNKTDEAALDHVSVKITLSVNSRNSDSNNSATIARFEQR